LKVTKSDFESKSVYLSLKEHIGAHFLICFIALVIVRILEYRLKGKYLVTEILECLNKASCSQIKENYYVFDFYNDVLKGIGKELKIDFSKKFMTLGEIKKILGETKKVNFHYNFWAKSKSTKPFILKVLRTFFILLCCKSQDITREMLC